MPPFYIYFFTFWHRFRLLWNLQVGAKLAKNTSHNLPQPVWNQLVTTGRFGKGLGMVSAGFGAGSGRFWARLAKVRGGFLQRVTQGFGEGFLIFGRWLVLGPPKQNY